MRFTGLASIDPAVDSRPTDSLRALSLTPLACFWPSPVRIAQGEIRNWQVTLTEWQCRSSSYSEGR